MIRQLSTISFFTFLFTACSSGAPEDIERICIAMTECGALPAMDTDECISELDASTPDSASRAANECATCLDTLTCGAIEDGDCASECEPLFDTINSVPGKVTGVCSSNSTSNYAYESDGDLIVRLECSDTVLQILPGPFFKTGASKPCGTIRAIGGGQCVATGNVSMTSRDGRRWVTGSCSCEGDTIGFEVPFRLAL